MAKPQVSASKTVYVDFEKLLSLNDRIVGPAEQPPNYAEMANGIDRKSKHLKTAINGIEPPSLTEWSTMGGIPPRALYRARDGKVELATLGKIVSGLQKLGKFQPALLAGDFTISEAEFNARQERQERYEKADGKIASAPEGTKPGDQSLNPMDDLVALPKSSDATAPSTTADALDAASTIESSGDLPNATSLAAKDVVESDAGRFSWYRKIHHIAIAIATSVAIVFTWMMAGAMFQTPDPETTHLPNTPMPQTQLPETSVTDKPVPALPDVRSVTLTFSNNNEIRDYEGIYARFASARDFLENAPTQTIEEDQDYLPAHWELLAPLKRRAVAEDGRFSVYFNENLTAGVTSAIPASIHATFDGQGDLILVVVRQGGFDFPDSRGFIVLSSDSDESDSRVFSIPSFIVNNKVNEHPSSLSFAALLYQPGRAPVVEKIGIDLIKDDQK